MQPEQHWSSCRWTLERSRVMGSFFQGFEARDANHQRAGLARYGAKAVVFSQLVDANGHLAALLMREHRLC